MEYKYNFLVYIVVIVSHPSHIQISLEIQNMSSIGPLRIDDLQKPSKKPNGSFFIISYNRLNVIIISK